VSAPKLLYSSIMMNLGFNADFKLEFYEFFFSLSAKNLFQKIFFIESHGIQNIFAIDVLFDILPCILNNMGKKKLWNVVCWIFVMVFMVV
jgi:hypothetical protein